MSRLKGLEVETCLADDVFDIRLPHEVDVLLFVGSLHNAPFEFSRLEAASLARWLRPGGLVLMLAYPRERYEALGATSFEEFGRLCDGERTPWIRVVRRRQGPAPVRSGLHAELEPELRPRRHRVQLVRADQAALGADDSIEGPQVWAAPPIGPAGRPTAGVFYDTACVDQAAYGPRHARPAVELPRRRPGRPGRRRAVAQRACTRWSSWPRRCGSTGTTSRSWT